MPQTEKTTVPAQNVRVGDVVVLAHGAGLTMTTSRKTVVNIDVKAKWTTIVFDDNSKDRIENTHGVSIERQVPTDEERYQNKREDALYNLRRMLEQYKAGTTAKYMADVAAHGLIVDYSIVQKLMKLQAIESIVTRMGIYIAKAATVGCDELHAFAGYVENKDDREDYRDPFSRSTNVLANLEEDVAAATYRDFKKDVIRWTGVDMARELAEFTAAVEDAKNA